MRKTLAVLAVLAATTAHAGMTDGVSRAIADGEISKQEVVRCLYFGTLANNMAIQRDSETMTPQQSYAYASKMPGPKFDDGLLKRTVNAVYFDSDFRQARPSQIGDALTNWCLDPQQKYEAHYEPVQ